MAEHGCLTSRAPDGRFYNHFSRGSYEQVALARNDLKHGMPSPLSLERYASRQQSGPLKQLLRRQGHVIVGQIHSHPNRTNDGRDLSSRARFPSAGDLLTFVQRNREEPVTSAVAFRDLEGRTAVTFYGAALLGARFGMACMGSRLGPERGGAGRGAGSVRVVSPTVRDQVR